VAFQGDSRPPSEAEVERALAGLAASEARAPEALRTRLRQAFVEGALEPGETASRPLSAGRTADGMLEHTITRGAGSTPARPEFKAELRERFVSGRLEEGISAPPALRPVPAARPLLRIAAAAALAAAAILVVALFVPRRHHWRATDFTAGGTGSFAGVPLSEIGLSSIGARLSEGGVLETGDGRLDLSLGRDDLMVAVKPGSRLHVARLPEPGSGEPIEIDIEAGEIYISTCVEYEGNPIVVLTADSRVDVTGTKLGVLVFAEGTCVCVAEGTVEVRPRKACFEPCSVNGSTSFVAERGERAGHTVPFAQGHGAEHDDHVASLMAFGAR
jgi:hypothetical protein